MNNDDRERRNEDISKRYIQTQVEKTGTNKISAVFPEENKRKFVGKLQFQDIMKIMQVNISNSYIIRRTKTEKVKRSS